MFRPSLERQQIDQERFDVLSARLDQSGEVTPTPIVVPSHAGTLESCAQIRAAQAKAQCPSCASIVLANTDTCPHCEANFAPGAAWKPVTISRRQTLRDVVEKLDRFGYAARNIPSGWQIEKKDDARVVAYAMHEDDLIALSQLASRKKPLATWVADLIPESERAQLLSTAGNVQRRGVQSGLDGAPLI